MSASFYRKITQAEIRVIRTPGHVNGKEIRLPSGYN